MKFFTFSNFQVIGMLSLFQLFSCNSKNIIENPQTQKLNITNNYFGVDIVDSYQWLENIDTTKVLNWLKTQNEHTENYFENFRKILIFFKI